MVEIFSLAKDALLETDSKIKTQKVNLLYKLSNTQDLQLVNITVEDILNPGRPNKPKLVVATAVNKRKLSSVEGRAAFLHAICHIEFNAINLALDAVYRFQSMPEEYYKDWIMIAKEESYHFEMLEAYLNELGFCYGDFVAHNSLWELAIKTAHNHLWRMALVPRLMEARGLDVTPGIINKFKQIKDNKAVSILKIIMTDEIGHVSIGTKWFNYLCGINRVAPEETFINLVKKISPDVIRKPLAEDLRLEAGFTCTEIEQLKAML